MNIKKNLDKSIFREYDIRGDSSLIDDNTSYTIGRGYASKLIEYGLNTCVVGHDNRISSDRICDALLKGIIDGGVDVIYIGLVTTPMHNAAMKHLKVESGIMVTASHNPTNDNGFKFSYKDYNNVYGEKIKEFYDFLCKGDFSSGKGTITYVDTKVSYLNELLKNININKTFKIAVDCANGTTAIIIRDVFKKLNLGVTYLNDISDGTFPNHHPDPFVKENMFQLIDYVKSFNLDLGIAYDGDGDRVGFVSNTGEIIDIDKFMALMCREIIPTSENKTVLYDVKCSKCLEDEIKRLGGKPYMYRTGGNTYVKSKVKEMDLAFGGELSGHVIFRDKYIGVDDGIYASLRFLEFLSNQDKDAASLVKELNKYYSTPEIKVKTTDDKKFEIVENVKKAVEGENASISLIDGVRIDYTDGFALVRASNTGPNLTLRFEAKTKERLDELVSKYTALVNELNT